MWAVNNCMSRWRGVGRRSSALRPANCTSCETGSKPKGCARSRWKSPASTGSALTKCWSRRGCKWLEGTWKEEHLFALRQAYELWQFYQQKIAECDQAIAKVLQEISGPEDPAKPAPPATKRGGVNAPQIGGLHSLLWRLCGHKDLTTLPGVADYVLLQLRAPWLASWPNCSGG